MTEHIAAVRPPARLDCHVRFAGHRHTTNCWSTKPPGVTHHASVWSEGRDWQCTCGSWGAAQPGYMGYESHIESVLRVHEAAASELLVLLETGPWTNRQRGLIASQLEDVRQRRARAF